MAQYWFDWANDAVDSSPAGVTKRFTTNDSLTVISSVSGYSGKVLRWALSSTARRAVSFDVLDNDPGRGNIKMMARVARASANTSASQIGLASRIAGGIGSETIYQAQLTEGTGIRIAQISAGSFAILRSDAVSAWANSSEYRHIAFEDDGTLVRMQGQLGGDYSYPTAWDISTTSGALGGSLGLIGLATFDSSVDYFIDYVAIGTGGDLPPTGPVETGPSDPPPALLSLFTTVYPGRYGGVY